MISIKYDKNRAGRKYINRYDNKHANKKFTSVDRRKILFSIVAGVVFFVFLLSRTDTYDVSLLLQQELDWPTSGSIKGIFGTAYASDEETSITEEVNENDEGNEGDQGKAFDVSDDDNSNDNTDDIDISNDNDLVSLKERPGWDPNGLKESESDAQDSVTTEPGDIGGSELQHCIGCSETLPDTHKGFSDGNDNAVMLPLGGVPLPTEEYLGATGYDSTEVVDTINGDDSAIYGQTSQLTILKDQPLVTKKFSEFQMESDHLINGGLEVADDIIVSDTSDNGVLMGQDVLSNPDQTFEVAYSEGEPYIPVELLSAPCPPGQVPSPAFQGECMLDEGQRDDYDDNPNPCPPGSTVTSSHHGDGIWTITCIHPFIPPAGSGSSGGGSGSGGTTCPDGSPLPDSGRVEDCPAGSQGATHK